MTTLGIIGSGHIGTAVATLAQRAGVHTVLANSRGPESLTEKVAELGDRVSAGTVSEAAAQDIVVLTIPLFAARDFPADLLAGRVVIDTSNYYPSRDGRIPELDSNDLTVAELLSAHFVGARYVKGFNNIAARHLPQLARPAGAPDRSALILGSDDAEALTRAAALLDTLGWDTVPVDSLAETWRFENDTELYGVPYLDAASTDPGGQDARPASVAVLREALAGATRADVGARTV
ncbi:NADP oxidoreductase [Mycetocola tolaasinivorans]|uniref:NADP oxidoreductase n=1 Tax=Mycetocola tolaasinivorans TaxID=76635 RepID=A0A3L7A3J4_9MICO|nr:NAD(P)-binding domain-containing protein [Mycetocola tolaasinivorans]RLP74508.1 NADP oxidoreductase [Mycetocola tolaasinivorans]